MSFAPKISDNKATPAPVIEKVDPAKFETPGDQGNARKTASTGRAALRIDRTPGLTTPTSTGLQIPG